MDKDYTTIKVPIKLAGIFTNLVDAFNHHYQRELDLADFIFSHGHTKAELARHLKLTPAAVTIAYPTAGKTEEEDWK